MKSKVLTLSANSPLQLVKPTVIPFLFHSFNNPNHKHNKLLKAIVNPQDSNPLRIGACVDKDFENSSSRLSHPNIPLRKRFNYKKL